MNCSWVDDPSKLIVDVPVGSGNVASVIDTELPTDRELPTKSLKELANTSLVEVTVAIMCDALSAAVKNELAISAPELVGSSILILPDLKEDESVVDCTSGTTIEILSDRVGSIVESLVVVVGVKSDVESMEFTLFENVKLAKEARIELVDTS